jgi:hypothetical protein
MGRQGMRPLPITDNSAGIRRQCGDITQGNPPERAAVSPVLVTPTPSWYAADLLAVAAGDRRQLVGTSAPLSSRRTLSPGLWT